jgi:hypothetical protein
MIAAGQLEVPIAEVIPLDEVQRAYSILNAATPAARSSFGPS